MPKIELLAARQRAHGEGSEISTSHPELPSTRVSVYRRYLKRAIFEGLWRCETPLSENALLSMLAKQYQTPFQDDLASLPVERGGVRFQTVSRTPLREALSSLEERRLIERGKAGKAMPRALTTRDRSEIFEARMLIEPQRAEKAVIVYRVSPEFRNRLELIWSAMDDAANSPCELGRYIELDIAFHTEIARASSEVLALVVEITLEQTVVGGRRASELANYLQQQSLTSKRPGIHAEHRAIYNAICAGNDNEAGKMMKAHVEQARRQSDEVARFLTF